MKRSPLSVLILTSFSVILWAFAFFKMLMIFQGLSEAHELWPGLFAALLCHIAAALSALLAHFKQEESHTNTSTPTISSLTEARPSSSDQTRVTRHVAQVMSGRKDPIAEAELAAFHDAKRRENS